MQLKLLWELQKLDLTMAAIQKSIDEAPEKSGVQEDEEQLKILAQELALEKENLARDRKTWRDSEMKIQKITDDRASLSANMYSDKTSAKELEQMQKRMEHLLDEKTRLEDELLALMEAVEEKEAFCRAKEEEITTKSIALKEKEAGLEADLAHYQSELAKTEAKRKEKLPALDNQLLQRYEQLALKHNGQALALVENDICGGCRVFVSSGLRGRLYNSKALVYCENCGRLLLRPETLE